MDQIEPTTEASGAGSRDWLQASQGVMISAYVPTSLIGLHELQPLTPPETRHVPQQAKRPRRDHVGRNRALHIPLDFETAVEGLLNVNPKKKRLRK